MTKFLQVTKFSPDLIFPRLFFTPTFFFPDKGTSPNKARDFLIVIVGILADGHSELEDSESETDDSDNEQSDKEESRTHERNEPVIQENVYTEPSARGNGCVQGCDAAKAIRKANKEALTKMEKRGSSTTYLSIS